MFKDLERPFKLEDRSLIFGKVKKFTQGRIKIAPLNFFYSSLFTLRNY